MSEDKKSTELAVPDYLKAMSGNTSIEVLDSMASASMSIPRISLRGKKFRFMEGGEEVAAISDKIKVVIFGVQPDDNHFIKTYYDKAYGGQGDSSPPTCSSDDGVAPSAWTSNPQYPNCAECPKNRFGSATSRSGKPSKACQDGKRLWVAKHEDVKAGEKPTIYALGVTVMSLKNLSEFGRSMKAMNVPISAAVVEVTMDDDSEFPMISFACVGFLPETEALESIARSEKAEWKSSISSRPAISKTIDTTKLPGQVANVVATAGGEAGATIDQTPKPAADVNSIVDNW